MGADILLHSHFQVSPSIFQYLNDEMERTESFLDRLFSRHRWAIHIIFWTGVLLMYSIFFGRKNDNYTQTFFFVGMLMPVTIGTTYFLIYFLLPRYLLKQHYGFFLLYFAYTLIIALFLEMIIAILTFILIAELQIRNMSPASVDLFFLMTSLLMVVFLGVAIKLLLHWRQSREDYQILMREKVEAELKFLKVQLNPHFLFNTLNNLYYLTTEKSDKAPRAILQLSEMLDYVLHSGKSEFVPLSSEIRQAENYIALEQLRYEDRITINKSISGQVEDFTIAPMILLTLIENAYKHGVMKVPGKSWINLMINCTPEQLVISVRNSRRSTEAGNGIGLENLKGRLSLLYGPDHTLRFENNDPDEFSVDLMLNKTT